MATLAELLVKIRGDATDFEKQMRKVEGALDRSGKQMQSIGQKLTTGLTLPMAAMGGGALKASIDFESAFAGVRKTVNGSEEDFAALEAGIRNMAKEIPQAATDIAGIAEAAGQLGIQKENILSFTRVMADLGVATNLSGEEAATALARLANITQMSQGDFDKLGSTIVALGNNLATTEAEIVEMGLRIAGAGSQVGMTEAEILSFAGALSSVGIEAEAGGSAISRVMIDIASSVANGDEKLTQFAKVAGMSASEFKTAWQNDASGALVTFIEGLGKMSAEGENTFGVLDELGLSEIRVRDALLRASNAGDLFRNSLQLGTDAWTENTALTKEAEQRYGTTQSQLTILWNKLKDVAITLGDALAPALTAALTAAAPFLEKITGLATWFTNLDPGIQQVIIGALGLVAALGPVLYIVGTLVTTFSGMAGVVKLVAGNVGGLAGFGSKLVGAFSAWSSGAVTFGGALNMALGPVGLIILGIAAVIAIGVLLYKHWDEISAWLTAAWEWIKNTALSVWNSIADFFTGLWDSITGALTSAWEGIKTAISNAWNGIADFFREWWGVILLGIVTGGIGLLIMFLVANWERILEILTTAWENIKTAVTEGAQNAWNSIVTILTELPGWLLDMMTRARQWMIDALVKLATAAWEGALDLRKRFIDGLESAWEYLKGLPSKMLDWGKAAIKGLVDGILSVKIPVPTVGISWSEGPMGLKIPSLDIGVNWRELRGLVPFLADGGIVDSPTLAMIGEAGPEAVVPLDRMDRDQGGAQVIIQWSSLARPSDSEVREVAYLLDREFGRLATARG